MIISDISICNNELIENKFAYRIFKERTLRNGNIIAFISKVDIKSKISTLYADEAINFLWEIQDIAPMTAVCIQRLFSSVIGNILSNSKFLNAKIEINEDKIIIHKEHKQGGVVQLYGQASLSNLHFINNTCIGYLGIYIKAGQLAPAFAFSTDLIDVNIRNQFMIDCMKEFYAMMQSIVIETSRI